MGADSEHVRLGCRFCARNSWVQILGTVWCRCMKVPNKKLDRDNTFLNNDHLKCLEGASTLPGGEVDTVSEDVHFACI